jgi:hypothetical protein
MEAPRIVDRTEDVGITVYGLISGRVKQNGNSERQPGPQRAQESPIMQPTRSDVDGFVRSTRIFHDETSQNCADSHTDSGPRGAV